MPVTPINVARVTQNLRSFNLLRTVQGSQVELFRLQNQLASGLRFQAPSEDPTRAAATSKIDRRLDVLNQLSDNLRQVNTVLAEGESAMQDAIDQVIDMHTLTSEAASDTLSADERSALSVVVDSAIEQMVAIANREYLDTHLFSGHFGARPPFEWLTEGVVFHGDNGRLQTALDTDLSQDTFTISGNEFFHATSSAVQGYVDLNPQMTRETRLSDLNGATGRGIDTGRIRISDGFQEVEVDLSGADTVGDVIDRLNAELPADMTASLTETSIRVQSLTSQISVTDIAGGRTAVELGIFTPQPTADVLGQDLDARVTGRTKLLDLFAGTGLSLAKGITIRNGSRVAQIDFVNTETVEDVLTRIDQSDAGVWARIGSDGKTIEVVNRISGSDLTIEERGGQVASLLGIRSMHAQTRLADLNDGIGVDSVEGDDIRFITADGTQIDVNLNDLNLDSATLQNVIDLINTKGGGAITAGLAQQGNGILITDNTAGAGALRAERLNVSPAIDSLGLNITATGKQLVGRDVNPIRVDSPFTGLLELRAALTADDAGAVTQAGQRLERNLGRMQEVQGRLAAKAKVMLDRSGRIEDESSATQVLRSDIRDVDITEAIVRFQQVQTALTANMTTASRILNLSLLDFMR